MFGKIPPSQQDPLKKTVLVNPPKNSNSQEKNFRSQTGSLCQHKSKSQSELGNKYTVYSVWKEMVKTHPSNAVGWVVNTVPYLLVSSVACQGCCCPAKQPPWNMGFNFLDNSLVTLFLPITVKALVLPFTGNWNRDPRMELDL